MSDKTVTLEQYVRLQKEHAKRGEWMANNISEFTENDVDLMWDLVREWVSCKGLAEAVDAVADAAKVIRKWHPDEQTRDRASKFEDTLNALSSEIGSSFGIRTPSLVDKM
jgi:hypothetical protein